MQTDRPAGDLETLPTEDSLGTTSAAGADQIAAQLTSPMPTDTLRAWTCALVLGVISFLLRVINLGFPNRTIFDEAYYAPEGAQMLQYGFEENRGYYFIVHPPFGKWNIALGQLFLGNNPTGWRLMGVVVGTGAIVILTMVVRRMTRSTLLGVAAGILLAADGFSFALSRTAILDIYLQFWVLLGFACLVIDRDRYREALARAVSDGPIGRWAPRVGFRWWRLAAGLSLGLACSVKWSAVYFLAVFAILVLFWDAGAHRTLGLRQPYVATLRRSLPTAFWDLGVVPVITYLATYLGWFLGENAQGRHWAEREGAATDYPFIPDALRSLWHMHAQWLEFHNGLSKSHPWDSNPWSWLVSGRPVLMVNDRVVNGEGETVMRTITMIGTPPLWWAFIPALLWMGWWVVSRRDWRAIAVLAAIAAGWGSWLINTDRTMFMFYMAPVVPFFIIAVTLVLADVLGPANASANRRQWGVAIFAFYLAFVIVMFGFFLPVLNGSELSMDSRQMRIWMTTW